MARLRRLCSIERLWLAVLGVALVVVGTAIFLVARPEPENKNYRDAQTYIGLTEAEAVERAEAGGLEHRVTKRDGGGPANTDDLHSNRVNFVIDDGKVSSADFY
jgi:hypothetical protein